MMRALLLLAAIWSAAAQAHRPSDAFLTLAVEGNALQGRWEIALRDLEAAAGVDRNRDGTLTWGELRRQVPALREWLPQQLSIAGADAPCKLTVTDLLINDRVDGRYAWFSLAGACQQPPSTLTITYGLLFRIDPTHRGIVNVTANGQTHSVVLSPSSPLAELSLSEASHWRQFTDYLREGVHHIWIGADHILFLLALLLPSVLSRERGRWTAVTRLRPALLDVAAVVTAFTLAHSITLTLAAFELLRLPTRLVESAIALSVMLAALNNLLATVTARRWAVAFLFGLVHGFGFASVLGELGLPQQSRLLSLFAFNVGVELGQLAIVALAVPLAYQLRETLFYRQIVFRGGSLIVAGIAAWWLLQRSGILET